MNKIFHQEKNKGFTLIELLIVGGFIAIIMAVTIRNFSRSKIFFNETVSVMVSDIRSSETKSFSGSQYLNINRCGYGVHRNSNVQYKLYVGPQPNVAAVNAYCTATDRNYNETTGPAINRDVTYQDKNLFDSRLEFKNTFSDIFFEPIEPKVFINNSYTMNSVQPITIGYIGQNCSTSYPCKTICVYGSGRIEVVSGSTCPAP